MEKYNYISNCPCVEEMNNITGRVFVRLSYEYGICFIKRELIPTLGMVCLETVISTLNELRDSYDLSAYINLFDIITLGLVELNFESTEQATNILPDFRLEKYGCEILKVDYDKYIKHQKPLDKFKGRIVKIYDDNRGENEFWKELAQVMKNAWYSISGYILESHEVTRVFFKTFLEEIFYEISKHRNDELYAYKLYDLLYFENQGDIISVDALPKYKLMVKDDASLEDRVSKMLKDEKENDTDSQKNTLYL